MEKLKYTRVEECCEILDSMRIPITASDRKEGKYPYYGANGIQDYVNDYIFDDELVLLAEDGGNFGSKEKPIAYRVSGKCWVNNHAHVLKPKEEIDVDYLCYSLMFYKVDGMINGATRKKLTQTAMKKMKIPLRNIVEQKKIVQQLNKIIEIREKAKKELNLLDNLIQARFVELFGDAVYNDKKWETDTVKNLCKEIYGGGTPSKAHPEYYKDGDIPWVSAKDVILEVLRRMSVKGGVGKVIEYCGEGVKTLTVPERATITNMGAELGATTSIFPSDETTLAFLKAQDRADVWSELKADDDAVYDEQIDIDLSQLIPLAACPHSPDNVKSVNEIGKLKIDQVCIGSCTNSSYVDMMKVAHILKGKTVDPSVSLAIAPGSKQVLNMIAENGALADMIAAGARILESACGPCIGMGQSPNSKGVSLRTFNRNFEGRSGTKDGQIYLVSPEMAAVSALTGYLTDPRTLGDMPEFKLPEHFKINDNMVVPPADEADMDSVEVLRGPNIKPFPQTSPLDDSIDCQVSLKVGDNITTDHIMPAGAKILPLRSNIPAISQHCFTVCDEDFPRRAKNMGKSIIVGGSNYGQGSSREHAALAPLYLGIKAVLVKSFARIHRANLINAGILPLTFVNEADYDKINQGDEIVLADVRADVEADMSKLTVVNKTTGVEIPVLCELTGRTKDIILAGGLLDYTREQLSK